MIWGRREREKNQGKQSFWACNNCRNVVISLWELRKRARGLDMKVISVFWVNSKFPFVLYDQSHPALFSCSVWCHRTDCYLQVCRHCLQLHLFRGFSSHYTDPLDSSLGWVLPSPGLWWHCFSPLSLQPGGYNGFYGMYVTHRLLCFSLWASQLSYELCKEVTSLNSLSLKWLLSAFLVGLWDTNSKNKIIGDTDCNIGS